MVIEPQRVEPQRHGRIVTFYSYKGGVGRTFTLANVGWHLADAGKRVLLVDFDLEAPGLHHYLALEGRSESGHRGVIDILNSEMSALAEQPGAWSPSWRTCVQAVGESAASGGALEFLGAGLQGHGYASRVTAFPWNQFYELGGAAFFDRLIEDWKAEYDFVLIDSRTGISDIGGVCTIHLPDIVVTMFTYNRQAIDGAALVARGIVAQRSRFSSIRGIDILPVAGRVELSEHQLRVEARQTATAAFAGFPRQLSREARDRYWDEVEIPYVPYYAYGEHLLRERPDWSTQLLQSIAHLAGYLAGPEAVPAAGPDSEDDYDVALSFAGPDRPYAESLAQLLVGRGLRVFYDAHEEASLWGKNLYEHLEHVYRKSATYCVMFLSKQYAERLWTNHERRAAQTRAFTENSEYILPLRLDDTEIPGISPTVGYLDCRLKTMEQVAGILVEKLARKRETAPTR